MTWRQGAIQHRRLRAPQANGGRLVLPPLGADSVRSCPANPALQRADFELGGASLAETAAAARRGLLKLAEAYAGGTAKEVDAPIILTGHQPELFHPGVWFKNFLTHHIALQTGGTAVNLLIDNDLARESSIRIPVRHQGRPATKTLPFDQARTPKTFEERAVVDDRLFDTFATRCSEALQEFGWKPLIEQGWPAAIAARREGQPLGETVAAARRAIERGWGVANLEVPLSRVCETPEFWRFAAFLLNRLPAFARDYNDLLHEYRQVHRIRSAAHPVPDLVRKGEWLEAPFWIWSESSPQRRQLFARRRDDVLQISDLQDRTVDLPAVANGRLDDIVAALAKPRDFKIRPRALTTTIYSRLFLCDRFIHGIGGAKYDQLTDAIIERFFGFPPPEYVVATATLTLPLPLETQGCDKLPDLRLQLREMHFKPEQFVEPDAAALPWIEQKQRAIRKSIPEQLRERHQTIESANDALREMLTDERRRVEECVRELEVACRHEQAWKSREFSFALFPEQTLQRFLLDF